MDLYGTLVPRENKNNAYAKIWMDKQKTIMIFLILAKTKFWRDKQRALCYF